MSGSSNRIAKNTILLYMRMLIMMLISLYTSRVLLKALGVSDYGIYNAVGGVVASFTVISGALSAAISRFITYELGTGNVHALKKVFSSAVSVQILLSSIVLILGESLGLWFLNSHMSIPAERYIAANWVLQFSILTFIINLISVPYNALIIAHEDMGIFAYISIFEAFLKLAVVLTISHISVDRLILYSCLLMLSALLIRLIYARYCKSHYPEAVFNFSLDGQIFKKILGFAGWNFLGNSSGVLMNSGINILINVFFGVTMNAARGVAVQVEAAVSSFVNSFTTAINPQITKNYASGNYDYMYSLIYNGARYSFYLVIVLAFPILLETDFILDLWLDIVPSMAPVFVRYILLITLVGVLSNTMVTAMLATGNIKTYQIIVGSLGYMVFFLTWILYYLGYPVVTCYIINIVIYLLQFLARLFLLKKMIDLSIRRFIKEVVFNIAKVAIIGAVIPISVKFLYPVHTTIASVLCIILSCVSMLISVFFIGIKRNERQVILNTILKRFIHAKN